MSEIRYVIPERKWDLCRDECRCAHCDVYSRLLFDSSRRHWNTCRWLLVVAVLVFLIGITAARIAFDIGRIQGAHEVCEEIKSRLNK